MTSTATRQRNLIRASEAGDYLGRNRRFIERAVKHRLIPFYRVSGLVLFDVADLDAYLESVRVEVAS